MKVVEIFKSIDGEGIRTGYPVTFIRLFGCNLRCSFCDTNYSYDGSDYKNMSVEDIIKECDGLNCKRITLTGGEPLIHEDVEKLIDELINNDYEVNIETNGSVDIEKYLNKNVILTLDYKCACSGMEKKMYIPNFARLRKTDVLKFVVGSKEDLETAKTVGTRTNAQVFISPVFGMIEPKEIVEYILNNNLNDFRTQVQLHKIIWDPMERGV